MVALLVFIMATLEMLFSRKILLDAKGPFGGNLFKNPARYIFILYEIVSIFIYGWGNHYPV